MSATKTEPWAEFARSILLSHDCRRQCVHMTNGQVKPLVREGMLSSSRSGGPTERLTVAVGDLSGRVQGTTTWPSTVQPSQAVVRRSHASPI